LPVGKFGKADRFCGSFVARKDKRPFPHVSGGNLNRTPRKLSHRIWTTISSSLSRESGSDAEFALTGELNIKPHVEFREGNSRQSKHAQDIFLRVAVLQLLSLVLDQFLSNFTNVCPVLPKLRNCRTFVPLHQPGNGAFRGKPEGIDHE
jgi:hypothetical protein